VLTETWLDSEIKSSELGLTNYKIYHCDRNAKSSSKTRGGGVLIAIKKKLISRKLQIKKQSPGTTICTN